MQDQTQQLFRNNYSDRTQKDMYNHPYSRRATKHIPYPILY